MSIEDRTDDKSLELRIGGGVIIFMLLVVFPPLSLWMYGDDFLFLYRNSIRGYIIPISSVGGCLACLLFAPRPYRVRAAIGGLFIGAGSTTGHLLYTSILKKDSVWLHEVALSMLLGAIPGMIIILILITKKYKHLNPNYSSEDFA